jgi:hypothetical protein
MARGAATPSRMARGGASVEDGKRAVARSRMVRGGPQIHGEGARLLGEAGQWPGAAAIRWRGNSPLRLGSGVGGDGSLQRV